MPLSPVWVDFRRSSSGDSTPRTNFAAFGWYVATVSNFVERNAVEKVHRQVIAILAFAHVENRGDGNCGVFFDELQCRGLISDPLFNPLLGYVDPVFVVRCHIFEDFGDGALA
ncbi:hypothetical protein IFR05_017467, partial [Cadophora sp. M221]